MSLKDLITQNLYEMASLGIAYRKAKVDLYYSSRCGRQALSRYERDLFENLGKLQASLLQGVAPKLSKDCWTLVPKGIKPNNFESELISSDPDYLWSEVRREAESGNKDSKTKSQKPEAEFRIMESLSIDFHVFAALWIQKVGHKFEAKLTSAACGNRLRRKKAKKGQDLGKLNPLSLGSTVPYLYPYCKWRDAGIQAMRDALDADKKVIAITADVSSFYHKLDVSFMMDADFMAAIGVELSKDETALHTLFIKSLKAWAEKTPLGRGLPVGLSASGVIANVALFELDRMMEEEVTPLYYGRYVDDIILVMENGSDFKNSAQIWDWLSKRSDGILKHDASNKEIRYKPAYLKGSEVVFENDKNKTFVLSGATGRSLLSSIKYEIQTRTSEWRSLPDLPRSGPQLEASLLTAIQSNGISADSLRKADKVSVRRAGFALKLRDVEAYARALPPQQWKAQRHAFLNAFTRHILVLPTFFDFFAYLSRVLHIATSCGDFKHLREMLNALEQVLLELEDNCKLSIKAAPKGARVSGMEMMVRFEKQLKQRVAESIEASFPLDLGVSGRDLWLKHFRHKSDLYPRSGIACIQKKHRLYIRRDLANRPLKQFLMNPSLSGSKKHPVELKDTNTVTRAEARVVLPKRVIKGLDVFARIADFPDQRKFPSGLLFPTRPTGVQDIYLLHEDAFSKSGSEDIADCLLALRGFKPEGRLPRHKGNDSEEPIGVRFKDGKRRKVRIAVASWKTEINSWVASVTQQTDPDQCRLDRLHDLLNAVLRCRERPDYLILPELSLPSHWFLAAAGKLQGKGISLISGVEYIHSPNDKVQNQVWAALSQDALGFPSTLIYRQDKLTPAPHEETELKRIGNKQFKPLLNPWTKPPLINHGGFQFATLVCSELTNIRYRADLRGNVDALFVPQWNQDTESFNALVESAALDIHAYIVQCNDREYGDSRIRVPHKDTWQRDLIRVKGGLEDYFVVGEIDIAALRKFQSSHRSPSKPFKPVPDGFNADMDSNRKTLPTAE